MKHVTLDSRSLFSKWGFEDGDVLHEWWYYTGRIEPASAPDTDLRFFGLDHLTLIIAVQKYLLPALPRSVETYRVSTLHNPIRAEDDEPEDFAPVEVTVTYAQLDEIAEAIIREQGA